MVSTKPSLIQQPVIKYVETKPCMFMCWAESKILPKQSVWTLETEPLPSHLPSLLEMSQGHQQQEEPNAARKSNSQQEQGQLSSSWVYWRLHSQAMHQLCLRDPRGIVTVKKAGRNLIWYWEGPGREARSIGEHMLEENRGEVVPASLSLAGSKLLYRRPEEWGRV